MTAAMKQTSHTSYGERQAASDADREESRGQHFANVLFAKQALSATSLARQHRIHAWLKNGV
jgi:hypothetical protein